MISPKLSEVTPKHAIGATANPVQLRNAPVQGYWSRQNVLWIVMAIAWWIGSLAGWWGVYVESWLMKSSDQWTQGALSSASIAATGLFILLISATLRLPSVTVTVSTTSIQNHLVWLLGIGANINWLGMLSLRSESLWVILPLVGTALVIEYWLINCFAGPGTVHESTNVNALSSGFCSTQQPNPESLAQEHLGDSEFDRVHRTMTDRTVHGGYRHLSGDIFVDWQAGQKTQILVVGFVPAFDTQPHVEFEADCADTVVRCQNCTQTGMRLEVKRTGPLTACQSALAWAATDKPASASAEDQVPSQTAGPSSILA